MRVGIHERTEFTAPVEDVWAFLTDVANMNSFPGYGPIPGIREARWIEGEGSVGAVRLVENLDGSTHREEIADLVEHERLEDRIYAFDSPLRFLVREIRDVFAFDHNGPKTVLERSFTAELRSPLLWPVAVPALELVRRAIRRQHAEIARRVTNS